tara:strand:- start:246 stop:470 length:225 start_codon:yes stop_codon:yes gene_type:complete
MAFKMKGSPMKRNFGISPMKNYKKGYYGEGSSFKSDEMAKAVAEAKAKNKKASEDPNQLQGIDPDKFAKMLRSE